MSHEEAVIELVRVRNIDGKIENIKSIRNNELLSVH
jgi:hypothetical protein